MESETKLKVEYLCIFNATEPYCKSIKTFNNLIQSSDDIKINGNELTYEKTSFDYSVQFGEIANEHQRFFHVKLACHEESTLPIFKQLLKSIRTILTKINGNPPETLWDDISTNLSFKAYPMLHEIENLLRKLIAKFMLTTIGTKWTTTIPKEVAESIKEKQKTTQQNYLHNTDFIQLSNFLFKEYSTVNSKLLIDKLRKAQSASDISIDELKEMVPQSNWERYFSPIVDCPSEYLKNKWEKLYELRCIVAHNRFMTEDEFNETSKTTQDIKEKISNAIANLDKIHVTEKQKDEVVENIASSTNEIYGKFIRAFNETQESIIFTSNLLFADNKIPPDETARHSITAIKKISDAGHLQKSLHNDFLKTKDIRHAIVHKTDIELDDKIIIDGIQKLEHINDELLKIASNTQPQ